MFALAYNMKMGKRLENLLANKIKNAKNNKIITVECVNILGVWISSYRPLETDHSE